MGDSQSTARARTAWDASLILSLHTPAWLLNANGKVSVANELCSKLPPWLQAKLKQDSAIWDPSTVTPETEELVASYHTQLKTGAPGRLSFKHAGESWTLVHFKATEPGSEPYVNLAIRDCPLRPERHIPQNSINDLKNFATEFHYIREEERAEVARNIHDHLGQEITVLRLAVHRLQQDILSSGVQMPPNWKSQFDIVTRQVDDVMKSAKSIAYELRPDVIRSQGLAAAASVLVIDFCKRSGIKGNIEVSVDFVDPPADMSLHFYRSLQEMLNNLVKHAKATSFFVRLSQNKPTNEYSLEVLDNGVGIPQWLLDQMRAGELVSNGMGLKGFMERAAIYGGRVEIRTRPEIKGSQVKLTLPAQRATSS